MQCRWYTYYMITLSSVVLRYIFIIFIQSSQFSFLLYTTQNEKELQEVIQQQNEKILEQIDKSGELIVRSP